MNNFPTSLLFTLLALAVVLALAWIMLRGLSSLSVTKSRGGRFEILDTIALGSKERLVLVRLDEKEILLGVTANSVRRIDNTVQ